MSAKQKIALVVRSLTKHSDSIGYDCVAEYLSICEQNDTNVDVRIFCDELSTDVHEGIRVLEISQLAIWISDVDDPAIIYHWRDGWPSFDDAFAKLPGRKIVRWHNNTPPWFFAPYSANAASNTIRGLTNICKLIVNSNVEFWANSTYSAEQLRVLGAPAHRVHVVYPSSPLLMLPAGVAEVDTPFTYEFMRAGAKDDTHAIRLLFVGRFVPHKGHKHLVATAAMVKHLSGRRVELDIVGRADRSMQRYVDDVKALAERLDVDLTDHGEVPIGQLDHLYRRADVFLFLSEHEGFGLPVLEAMRFGLPVVGVRANAVAEFLNEHPLAVDRIDHVALARNVLAAVRPNVRASVVRWQRRDVLAGYSTAIIGAQIQAGLAGRNSSAPRERQADPTLHAMVAAILATLPDGSDVPADSAAMLREIPADAPDRMMTLYDVEAYATLLRTVEAATGGHLYKTTWRTGFPHKRRFFSGVYRQIRRLVLSLNFGLVASIDQAKQQTSAQLDRLAEDVETLKEQNARILERLRAVLTERDLPADRSGTRIGPMRGVAPMLQSVPTEADPLSSRIA